jgi:hypothetical protein
LPAIRAEVLPVLGEDIKAAVINDCIAVQFGSYRSLSVALVPCSRLREQEENKSAWAAHSA